MTILVTGSAGFIGFHTVIALLKKGKTVIGVDDLNSYYDKKLKFARNKFIFKFIKKNKLRGKYKFFKIDISNNKALKKIFKKYKFKNVIHLAAQAGVRYSIKNPSLYVKSNLVGFGNILENSKNHNIKHLIYASSSSVYGERDKKKPFSEKDPVDHPIQFYAATKRANELMAHAYSHLFNMPTTGIRFFTAYGPWGRPDMALYKFTENIYKNKKIQIYNKGNHTRDFTYIDDVITGIMKCLGNIPKRNNKKKILKNPSESNAPFRIINIGNGKSIQLKDYIKLIEYNLRKKAKKIFLDKQKGDVKDTWADTKKLQTVLKYKTNISAKKGVKSFVEWYKEYYNKKK
jgi:UDP-glucuronate 4-epimerase